MINKKSFYLLHADVCKTLANPKRLEILDVLRDKEVTVNELAEMTGMSQANLSQHLSVLRASGIVRARRQGVNIYYTVSNPKIIEAYDLISDMLRETTASRNRMVNEALGTS
jgi:ArsR family transcriptional regulator